MEFKKREKTIEDIEFEDQEEFILPKRKPRSKRIPRKCLRCDETFLPIPDDERICKACKRHPKFKYAALLWGD